MGTTFANADVRVDAECFPYLDEFLCFALCLAHFGGI